MRVSVRVRWMEHVMVEEPYRSDYFHCISLSVPIYDQHVVRSSLLADTCRTWKLNSIENKFSIETISQLRFQPSTFNFQLKLDQWASHQVRVPGKLDQWASHQVRVPGKLGVVASESCKLKVETSKERYFQLKINFQLNLTSSFTLLPIEEQSSWLM